MLSTLCAPTFAQTCTVPGFTQPPVYPVGTGNGVSNVSIQLGDGQGSFSAPASFLAPADQIVAADFNIDGKLDLAIVGNVTQIRLVKVQP